MRTETDFDVIDLRSLDEMSAEQIPAMLCRLAAAQATLAARLLAGTGSHSDGEQNRLLTAEETAQRLGVSPDWVYRNSDKLKCSVRLGRALRFLESGIEKWIRSRSGR